MASTEQHVLTETVAPLTEDLRTILEKVKVKTETSFGCSVRNLSYTEIGRLINMMHQEIIVLGG